MVAVLANPSARGLVAEVWLIAAVARSVFCVI
jgi:hypothetical protein